MRRPAGVLALIAGLAGVAGAQPQKLDPGQLPQLSEDPPQVILLTFGVGARIFERFGHAAICLRHAHDAEPVCFNYGVTDFNAGSVMVWNFLRTHQKFWVEPEAWSAMLRFYKWEDRDVWMQPLALAPDAARALEMKIYSDLEEAHRYYYYDHFYDNCTTRVRDMIDNATDHRLSAGTQIAYPLTFREMGWRGIAVNPTLIALSDFVLGRQLDDKPSVWDAMFEPDVLRFEVEQNLGVAPQLLYKRRGPAFPTEGSTFRAEVLLLALVFALPLLVAQWRRRLERVATAWATVWLAGWGLVIWGLIAISSIPGVRWNEAALVLMPLDLALPILGAARRRRYARARVVELLLVSALCAIGVLHQPLWIPILTAIIPLAIVAFDLPLGARPPRSPASS